MRTLFKALLTVIALCGSLSAQRIIKVFPDAAATAVGEVCFYDLDYPGTIDTVCIDVPTNVTTDYKFTLPPAPPGSTECLQMDSSGNVTTSGAGCGGSGGLPVVDTTSIVEGSADNTKEIRFEVDGITTGTVRVLTPPDADITIAGINLPQTFTATQTFQHIKPSADSTYDSGELAAAWQETFSDNFKVPGPHASVEVARIFEDTGGAVLQLNDDDSADTPETIAVIGANSGSDGYMELFTDDGYQLMELGDSSGEAFLDLYESGVATGKIRLLADGANPDLTIALESGADVLPDTDADHDFGSASLTWDNIFGVEFHINSAAGTCRIFNGSGAPGGGCTTCDMVLRTDGGSSTTLYVCESGSWVAK